MQQKTRLYVVYNKTRLLNLCDDRYIAISQNKNKGLKNFLAKFHLSYRNTSLAAAPATVNALNAAVNSLKYHGGPPFVPVQRWPYHTSHRILINY
jgi:hypothetical protein